MHTGETGRDYVGIAKAYARDAALVKNNKKFCEWMRLAGRRFTADLKRSTKKDSPFVFSEAMANDACDFIEKLPHVEGAWDTPTITLHASDVFFIVQLFGFRNHEGGRRFTAALKAIARKNAKSTIAAAIALYCQVCEGEQGPQVISGATTGAQARIVFGIAKRMVEKTPALRAAFLMEPFAHAIASYSNGGTFKPINAKASTQDGLNPSCVVLDEIHAHKDGDLLNVLQSASGARANPLFLFTTTEGYESPGPWAELRHFAKQVLNGAVEADHFLVVYYSLDDDDDDFDETVWAKANPLIDANPLLLREMRKQAIEAKAMPGKLPEFRIKRLNRQSETSRGWIDFHKWRKCAQPVDLEWLEQYPCYGGLDLANTFDLCAFRLVWYVDGHYYTHGLRWVSEQAINQRTVRGTIPYNAWVTSGQLIATPGEVIDHKVVVSDILRLKSRFNIVSVGYDNWNAAQVAKELCDEGLRMEVFIQGGKSYNPAMKEFERAYMAGRFSYGTDPVLTWNAANIVTRTDDNMNMAPNKKKSAEKIDDMCAMLMGFGRALAENDQSSMPDDYELMIL